MLATTCSDTVLITIKNQGEAGTFAAGAKMAFGKYLDTLLHFDKADVVVSFDSDAFEKGPGSVRYTADFAARRAVEDFDKPAGDTHHEAPSEAAEETHEEFHAKLKHLHILLYKKI